MIPKGSAGPFTEYSLYIHVPFCRSFCDYCGFYSVILDPLEGPGGDRNLGDRYIDALAEDARRLLGGFPPASVPSVYIGGGTPSVLGAEGMGRLLAVLGDLLPPPAEDREWTVEANPESLDGAFLRVCREGGVNRLSLGIQSLSPRLRGLVHRRGGAETLYRALALGEEFFPRNFSVDLLAGLPDQKLPDLLGDLEAILRFHPAHVSLYSLTPEEGTPLWDRQGELPPGDLGDFLWIAGRDALEGAGYGQYEVSNFSLPGKESRHNLRYWAMKNWLALGPSGSGTLIDDRTGTARRYTWPADLDAWLSRRSSAAAGGNGGRGDFLPPAECLDQLTLMKESLLMGFRCTGGPDGELFARRFGLSPEEAVPETLGGYRKRGLATPTGCALTKGGLLFLDPFLLDAFDELDRSFGPDAREVQEEY